MQAALNSRIVIEQAKGLLAHAAQIPAAQAFERLRAYSRNNNVRLSDVAEQLVRGTVAPHALPDPPCGSTPTSG